MFQQNDKSSKATNTKPYLQNILNNLEEKQISDQKVFMRKVNSAEKRGYYCPLCLLSFESINNLNKHNEDHFTRRNFTIKCLTPKIDCPLCKKTFFQKSSFKNHLMDNYHVNSVLMQPRVVIKKPSQISKPDKSLKCPICTKKFLKTSIFEKHKLFHRTSSFYECPNCFKSFDSLKKVVKHKSIHMTKEKKFECFCCKKDFSKYFSLLSHFQSKVCRWNRKTKNKQISFHAQENKVNSNDTISKEDIHSNLESIHDEFLNLGSYEAHPIKVVNSDDVTCSVCQARFTAPTPSRIMDSFNNHAKFHTRLYPFECPYCYMGYHSLLEMKIHKRNHILNDTKYTCTVCSTVFENFSQFRRHLEESGHRNIFKNDPMDIKASDKSEEDYSSDFELDCKSTSSTTTKIISPKRKYECPLCLTSLGCNSEAFATHIKLHKTLTSNVCQYCFQEFNDKNDVEKHLEMHHEDKLYKCPYNDFVSANHSSLLLHFELENHKSCNNNALKNLKANKLENKSYGQDKGLELGKHFNKRTEIEVFDQVITEVHPSETEQGETKTFKKTNGSNIFSTSYKSSELKKCEICFMDLGGERSLKSHQKTHLTGFPLECSQCLMGFEDEYKLKKHREQHQGFFECLSCSEEFETYVRFLKHLEDTNHNNAYKNSYRLHSKLLNRKLEVMFKNEEEKTRITDLVDSEERMDHSLKTPLQVGNMFPEQEDLKFDCSKSVNFVLDDELHYLSDTDQKEKEGCTTESNDTFSVEQTQFNSMDFESSDSNDTIELLNKSNIEHFCNTDLDENETKPFGENVKENKSILNFKISSILTDAGSVLSCKNETEDFGDKDPEKRITTFLRREGDHKFSESENAGRKEEEGNLKQITILSESRKCDEKHNETKTLPLDRPSHSPLNTTRMDSNESIEGQDTNCIEIQNKRLNDNYKHDTEIHRKTDEFTINVFKDNDLFDGKSRKDKEECSLNSPGDSVISFSALEEKYEDFEDEKTDTDTKPGDKKDNKGSYKQPIIKGEDNKTAHSSEDLNENEKESVEQSSMNQRIPIYKKAFFEPCHKEFFSEKFVNRNTLLKKSFAASRKLKNDTYQNLERKFIERRKFGSLNTKFQGRKQIISNVVFSKDDPFSIETEEAAVNPSSSQVNLGKSAHDTDNISSVAGPTFHPDNPDMQSCVKINEKSEQPLKMNKGKSIKQGINLKNTKKKKEDVNKTFISGIEPSCPHCFKILLNQEKMKLHIDQCKKNQEATQTTNLKFKIKLQSDSKSILEKID